MLRPCHAQCLDTVTNQQVLQPLDQNNVMYTGTGFTVACAVP